MSSKYIQPNVIEKFPSTQQDFEELFKGIATEIKKKKPKFSKGLLYQRYLNAVSMMPFFHIETTQKMLGNIGIIDKAKYKKEPKSKIPTVREN